MCGIVGCLIAQNSRDVISQEKKNKALDYMGYRGPDSRGQYHDDKVWLGHVRLSIIDLSKDADQPMTTQDGRYTICYNGEVYNFRDLKKTMNLQFLQSKSDTEVVLSAFTRAGVNSFSLMNGMFAYAIYDRVSQKLWLVRDRVGIKPLFYSYNQQGFYFASEIKSILAMKETEGTCNTEALHEWLYYGNTLGEQTLYKSINRLLPGHYIEFDIKTHRADIKKYWDVKEQSAKCGLHDPSIDLVQKTRNLVELAVKNQLVSDVPVGVFLSGGIDSSAITAFASKHYEGRITTYSTGFDFDKGINELPEARKVAKFYGTNHHELHVSGFEVADIVEKMVYHHDMPFSDAANIPLYLMAKEVNQNTKVVLQGDGGDELFAGYSRYTTLSHFRIARSLALLGKNIHKLFPQNSAYYRIRRYLNALNAKSYAHVMALLLTEEDTQSNPTSVFSRDFKLLVENHDPLSRYICCQSQFNNLNMPDQMGFIDSMIILPDIFLEKVDRSTMAASVEVRVPFLDNDLVEFCMSVPHDKKAPWGRKKWLLKKALKDIVPAEILSRKKTGFGVPYGFWLEESLRSLFFDNLLLFQKKHPGILDENHICNVYRDHVNNIHKRAFLLWKILNFMIWANQTSISFDRP